MIDELGVGTVDFMKTIKQTIDPLNLFNPGKVSRSVVRRDYLTEETTPRSSIPHDRVTKELTRELLRKIDLFCSSISTNVEHNQTMYIPPTQVRSRRIYQS